MDRTELTQKAEQWCDFLTADSKYISEMIYSRKFDDSAGYGNIACQYISALNSKVGGLWLRGPEGSGKHNAVNLAVSFLRDTENTEYEDLLDTSETELSSEEIQFLPIFVSGYDLNFTDAPSAEADVYFSCLLNRFTKDNDLCIILDSMEQCSCSEIVMDRIGRLLFRFYHSEASVILILIDNGTLRVPPMLRQHLMRCTFYPPSYGMREQFIKKRWSQLTKPEDEWKSELKKTYYRSPTALSIEQAVELTEGYTFGELVEFAENAVYVEQSLDYGNDSSLKNADDNAYLLSMRLGAEIPEEPEETDSLHKLEIRKYEDQHILNETLLSLLPDLVNALPDLLASVKSGSQSDTAAVKHTTTHSTVLDSYSKTQPTIEEITKIADDMTGDAIFSLLGMEDLITD